MDRSGTLPSLADFDPVKADWLPIQVYESREYRSRMGKDRGPSNDWQVQSCAVLQLWSFCLIA